MGNHVIPILTCIQIEGVIDAVTSGKGGDIFQSFDIILSGEYKFPRKELGFETPTFVIPIGGFISLRFSKYSVNQITLLHKVCQKIIGVSVSTLMNRVHACSTVVLLLQNIQVRRY